MIYTLIIDIDQLKHFFYPGPGGWNPRELTQVKRKRAHTSRKTGIPKDRSFGT